MSKETIQQLLKRTNLVHPTELGTPLIEYFFQQLEARDPVPSLPRDEHDSSNAKLLSKLAGQIKGAKTLDEAVASIQESSYFAGYLQERAVMIAQVRNQVPSDVTIVYRAPKGSFRLESMFSVSHADPAGPLVVDERLTPCTRDRPERGLQRRSFDLHELASLTQLLESHTYRVIFDELHTSWHAVILDRSTDFTWVVYFWYRFKGDRDYSDSVLTMRAGFDRIAESLGDAFLRERKLSPSEQRYCDPNSLQQGLLVFEPGFDRLFRQNFAAEAIIQGLVDQQHIATLRPAIYNRIALEHGRRLKAGMPLRWTVGSCFHPCEADRPAALRVSIRSTAEGSGHLEVLLDELHRPHLPHQRWWDLPRCKRDGLGKALLNLGKHLRLKHSPQPIAPEDTLYARFESLGGPNAYYMRLLSGVARPVWDIDLIAGRINRYPHVPATDVGRGDFNAEQLKTDRLWTITSHNRIAGVLHAV